MSSNYSFTAIEKSKSPVTIRGALKWIVILFILVPLPMLFLPWVQNISGKGIVIGFKPADRRQKVDAPIMGFVTKWHVSEGSRVKAGDVLLEMSDIDPNFNERLDEQFQASANKLDAKHNELEVQQQRLQNNITMREAKVASANFKREMAQQKVVAATQAIAAAEATLEASVNQLARMRSLLDEGLVSRRDFEVADRDNIVSKRQLASIKAQFDAAKAEEKSAQVEISQIRADADSAVGSVNVQINKIQAELADSKSSLAGATVNVARQNARLVLAPRAGTVLRLTVFSESQIIGKGQALLEIVPESKSGSVELYVSGRDAPLIVPGSPVRLQFEGWPAVQVAGWPRIKVGTFAGKVAFVDATDNGYGKFRVMVLPDTSGEIWPGERFLRQGTAVNGWILLEKVTVGYELWRMFHGFPLQLPKDASPIIANDKSNSGYSKSYK